MSDMTRLYPYAGLRDPRWPPNIRYAADARGTTVPDFAVVFAWATMRSPAKATVTVRRPGERGLDFVARVLYDCELLAPLHGCGTGDLDVLFQGTLPPREYRERWHRAARLCWMLALPLTGHDLMRAARDELARVGDLHVA